MSDVDGLKEVRDRTIAADGRCDDPKAVFDTVFKLGDYVVDRETLITSDMGESHLSTEDTGVAVVVREGRAATADIHLADGQSIADVNPTYPGDDPAVTVAFVATLDADASWWRAKWERQQLDWRLEDFKAEWDVEVATYTYPASRLIHAAEVADLDMSDLPGMDAEDGDE